MKTDMEDRIGKWSVETLELNKGPFPELAAELRRSRSQFATLNLKSQIVIPSHGVSVYSYSRF
jgi:hypothetical protein